TACAAVWIVPGRRGLGTSDLATMATLAPSRAARSAIARPMPREAPVMKRVLPARVAMVGAHPQWERPGPRPADDRTGGAPGRVPRALRASAPAPRCLPT